MKERTPGPWEVIIDDTGGEFSNWPSISAPEDLDVTIIHRAGFKQEYWGDLPLRKTLANAAFIVKAVNNHDKLVDMLGEMMALAEECSSYKGEWLAEHHGDQEQIDQARSLLTSLNDKEQRPDEDV